MRLVPIALLAVSLLGSARPARSDGTACRVTLTGAPDEIREIVNAWLRGEPRCGAALDVAIAAQDGGYLLEARDARGARRVRFAPDAQIAGALIASWAADGSLVLAAPGDGLAGPPAPEVVLPPSAVLPAVMNRLPEPVRELDPRLLLGAIVGAEQGMLGEIDLVALPRHVSLGVALAARTGSARIYGVQRDLAASGYAGLSFAAARWLLRIEIGAGLQVAELRMYNATNQVWATAVERSITTDASLTASRELVSGWAVTGGVRVTVLPAPGDVGQDQVAPMALLGVSCRL